MASYGIFTPREREIMIGAWHIVDIDQVQVDSAKLMGLTGKDTVKTTNNRFNDGKKKVKEALKNSKVAHISEFTDTEATVLILAWQCVQGKVTPDWKRGVELGISKTEKTASNRWGDVHKKFKTDGADTPTSTKTPKSNKSIGTKRKAAGDGVVNETPTKRAKRAAPAKLTVEDHDAALLKEEPVEEDDDAALAIAAEEQVLRESEA